MKRLLLFFITTLILICGATARYVLRDSVCYFEADFIYYRLYTADEIKGAPRLNGQYHFCFSQPDGNDPGVSAIVYSGVNDITALHPWLIAEGYKKVSSQSFVEKWQQEATKSTIFLTLNQEDKSVTLGLEQYSPYYPE